MTNKKAISIGPHWEAGETPINVGSYTNIKPVIDERCGSAPCRLACPLMTDIEGFITLATSGEYEEALKLIKQANPLPLVTGRVCVAFCETKCRRGAADEPLAIRLLERFIADYDQYSSSPYVSEVKPNTGHKVAIIGGGPAGLSATYFLAMQGHAITIFDKNDHLGGMLRYGIPEYRLPKQVIDREIVTISKLCSEIRYNTCLGTHFTISDLKKQGYEAILIAIGCQIEKRLGIAGENSVGVFTGLEFLHKIASGHKVDLGKRVAVVGGGNTAVDVARTALRLGTGDINLLYRRSQSEMTAISEEVKRAQQEGVRIHFLVAPARVQTKDDQIDSLECVRTALGEPDSSGRRAPRPIPGSEFSLKADTIVLATGQTVDAQLLPTDILNPAGYVSVKAETMATPIQGIFASGPATVVEAIAGGRRAAAHIDQYLSDQPSALLTGSLAHEIEELPRINVRLSEEIEPFPRVKVSTLPLEARKASFSEAELGLAEEMTKREADRCLKCGSCALCWLLCPDGAITSKEGGNGKKPVINHDLCKSCGICAHECPLGAIEMRTLEP